MAFFTLTALEVVLGIDNIIFITIPANRLTAPLFDVPGHAVSGRDLILLLGGLFLIAKSTMEIHASLEGPEEHHVGTTSSVRFLGVIAQIGALDISFSLDSVITAVGLVDQIPVMIAAIVTAVLVMMWAAGPVGRFVEPHPTVKMLALWFLILIGGALAGEGAGLHIPKGYVNFAMAFSLAVEMLNMRLRRKRAAQPLQLHNRPCADTEDCWTAPAQRVKR